MSIRFCALPLVCAVVVLLDGIAGVTLAQSSTDANSAKIAAAMQTAQQGANCRTIGDFYWEIGDARGPLVSGVTGSDYSATKSVKIASASKLVWGAYVLEKIGKGHEPDANQLTLLEMQSGHTAFNPLACLFSRTVESCFNARSNSEINPDAVGKFAYGGGHDQQLAVNLGLGDDDAAKLTTEIRSQLGQDLGLGYLRPQPAGGMEGTPADYARFLRKIINGQLRMRDYLGAHPVCTLPTKCATALQSPVREAWHYSINHWVEDDPATGDGSFSSPGLEGFYPWISADKSLYGIVARQQLKTTAAWESVVCGRSIRKAFVSGTPVLQ